MTETNTLQDEKLRLRLNFQKGTKCKCCGQFVKEYPRLIGNKNAQMLIRMYQMSFNKKWIYSGDVQKGLITSGGGDWAKLKFWGLIIQKEKKDGDTKRRTSGMWRISEKGIAFATNQITLPKYAMVYNGTFIRFKGNDVSIIDSLGKDFNYRELMDNYLKL